MVQRNNTLGALRSQESIIEEMLYKDMICAFAFQEEMDRGSGKQSCRAPALSATAESVIIEIKGWKETSAKTIAYPCLTEELARWESLLADPGMRTGVS